VSPPVQPQQDFSTLYDAQQKAAGGPAAPAPPNDFSALFDAQQAAQKATPGLPETILDQASRGASLGFAPQLMGAIKGAEAGGKYLLSDMRGTDAASATAGGLGNAISQGYTGGRDALRAQYDAEQAAHPVISRVADIGGSLGGALMTGGTNLLGSAAERLAPKIAGNMLGRVVTRGTLPAIEAGAERAIGETRDNNYAGNVAQSVLPSAALGTLFGTAGQIGGRLAEARAGAAAKGAQYAASDATEIQNPALTDKLREYIDRPGFAKAYQKAVDNAANEGNPLPELPERPPIAPAGMAPNATAGTGPGPYSPGLSVRLIDALKRQVDLFHNLPPAHENYIGDKAYGAFYKDIIDPADQAAPIFGAARGSAQKVAQARKMVEMLTGAGKSPMSSVLGGATGFALGHSPAAMSMGALLPVVGRGVRAMAGQPAAAGVVPDATAALARALSSAAARRDAQP
jgi:hypothetical protein